MIDVERVDFIRVPVTDMEEANHFYGEVLGLERNPNSPGDDWVEYEAGNVTLAVMTPHTHVRAPRCRRGPSHSASRTWPRPRRRSRPPASRSRDVGLGRLQRRRIRRPGRQCHPPSPPLRAVPRRLDALDDGEAHDGTRRRRRSLPRLLHVAASAWMSVKTSVMAPVGGSVVAGSVTP